MSANTIRLSECCDAEVREKETADDVIELCSNCGKPCDIKEVCEFCRGTGKIEGTDSDGFPSGHYRKCQECADDTSGDND